MGVCLTIKLQNNHIYVLQNDLNPLFLRLKLFQIEVSAVQILSAFMTF